MATQQTVPHSFSVVPFPAVEPITQLELTVFLSLRGRFHQLEEQVKQAEQSIKTRLEHGAALEPGDHRAELKENFRRNVAWKAVVILGRTAAAERRKLLREGSQLYQAHTHHLGSYRVTAMTIQAKVALEKQSHPERFCPFPRCLWRTAKLNHRTGDRERGGYCPRHRGAVRP